MMDTRSQHLLAEEWGKGIMHRLGDGCYLRLWKEAVKWLQKNRPEYETSDCYLFFCGYLLGPPGVVDCCSLDVRVPFPVHPPPYPAVAKEYYQLGIRARIEKL